MDSHYPTETQPIQMQNAKIATGAYCYVVACDFSSVGGGGRVSGWVVGGYQGGASSFDIRWGRVWGLLVGVAMCC